MSKSANTYKVKNWQVFYAFLALFIFICVAYMTSFRVAVAWALIISLPIGFLYNLYLAVNGYGGNGTGIYSKIVEPNKATKDDRRRLWSTTLVLFLIICYFIYSYFSNR